MPGLQKRVSTASGGARMSLVKQDTVQLSRKSSTASTTSSRQVSLVKHSSKTGRQTSNAGPSRQVSNAESSRQATLATVGSLVKNASVAKQASTSSLMAQKRKSDAATSGKRKRLKTKPFELEADKVVTPKKRKRSRGKKSVVAKKPARRAMYLRSEYLAIRCDEEEGFYLGQALQHIWPDTDTFRIHWFSNQGQPPGTYLRNFPEMTMSDCIITHVRVQRHPRHCDKFSLPDLQKAKILRILKKAQDREKGLPVSSDEDEADSEEEGSPKKKAKMSKSAKGSAKSSRTKGSAKGKLKRTLSQRQRAAAEKKSARDEARRLKREAKEAEQALLTGNPNARLKVNPAIKVLEKDPFLQSNDKLPFVSSTVQSKLVHRAVMMGDQKLLQTLIDDVKRVATVGMPYSVGLYRDPLHMAILNKNKKAIQLLVKELFNRDVKKKPRVKHPKSLLQAEDTGRYNFRSLGVPVIRALAVSRGSREGNNAFTKDLKHRRHGETLMKYVQFAIREGADKATIDALLTGASSHRFKENLYGLIWLAVRHGHRKLAGQLAKEREATGMTTFNAIHRDVLLFDNEDFKQNPRALSVQKKPFDNKRVTPIHCAAINPNTKYLSKLLHIVPEYGITDERLARPIHYAAACEGPGPLELLLKRGQDAAELDGQGMTPLMIACETGRQHNVELLIKKAKDDAKEASNKSEDDEDDNEEDDEEEGQGDSDKYGLAGISRPVLKPQCIFNSYCALHIAVEKGQLGIVKLLLENGADVNQPLSPSKDKKSPLMLAASQGNLAVVRLLVKHKGTVELRDKVKRTALMYAVMSGHGHVVSYFLHLGASADHVDSSGNTCVHYAAGYGWYHVLKLLLQAGAHPHRLNDWKTTPLGVAFMKGHMGLVNTLLECPEVDIDFKDDKGMSLVAVACSSPLEDGIVEQVEYLVKEKAANCNLLDVDDASPLHHLAQNSVASGYYGKPESSPDAMEYSVKIAELLISGGCDAGAKTKTGVTPIMGAVERGNSKLVEFLISKGGAVTDAVNKDKKNVLHLLATQCTGSNVNPVLKRIVKSVPDDMLKSMVAAVDNNGFTPLLQACQTYSQWNGNISQQAANAKDDDGDDSDQDEEDEEDEEQYDTDEDCASDQEIDEQHYKKAQVVNRLDSEQVVVEDPKADKQWQDSRDFIQLMIKLCKSDVDTAVHKRYFDVSEILPKEEEDHYLPGVGLYTPAHFLLEVKAERPTREDGKVKDSRPGLTMLLKEKPNLDLKDVGGRTPLMTAIVNANPDSALKLSECKFDVNQTSGNKKQDGEAPALLLAAKMGMEKVVAALAKKSPNVNARDSNNKRTALHYAAELPNPIGILKVLVKAKCDMNAVDNRDRTPLHHAVNVNKGSSDVTSETEQFLIENGSDVFKKDKRGRFPLHYAFVKINQSGDTGRMDPIELCSTLVTAMNGRQIDVPDAFGQTPLHRAALRGAGVCCMHLIQKKADMERPDTDGNTALALAVNAAHESCAIMLIQKGANIGVDIHIAPPLTEEEKEAMIRAEREEDGKAEAEVRKVKAAWQWKPLREPVQREAVVYPVTKTVIEHEWQGVIYMILDRLEECGVKYVEIVQAALKTNKYHLAMTLILKSPDKKAMKHVNKDAQNLFHVLCETVKVTTSAELLTRVADKLHERDVTLTPKDARGCTPLHYACVNNCVTLVSYIIDNGQNVDVNAKDKFGRTPFGCLLWQSYAPGAPSVRACCDALSKAGGNINVLCDYPPIEDALFGFTLTGQKVPYHKASGQTRVSPLIRAITARNFSLVRSLIVFDADINLPDEKKVTPMMYAVKSNDLDLVRLLLDTDYKKETGQQANAELEPPSTIARQGAGKVKAPKGRNALKKVHSRRLFKVKKLRKKVADDSEGSDDEASDEDEDGDDEEAKEEDEFEAPTGDIHLDFEEFHQTSSADLMAKDAQGWTIAHHLVCPLPFGSYDNVRLLHMLFKNGAPINSKDNAGMTPLDYALRNGVTKLARGIQKFLGIKKDKWETPRHSWPEVKDGVKWTGAVPDFRKDADALLARLERDSAKDEEKVTDDRAEPDPKLNMKDTGEVVQDADQQIPYDALLTKIDVKKGTWGLYNFYKLQVVHQKGKDLYVLLTRWGRIGDDGQYQRTPFPKVEEAIKEFCKIFRSKTGNDWKKVKTFENKDNRYRLVTSDRRKTAKKLKEVGFKLKGDIPSKLPEYVEDLMKELTDVSAMTNAIRHQGVSDELMPFGRIKRDVLFKARDILKEIKVLVTKVEARREVSPIADMEAYFTELETIASLSSEYYHLIPKSGYAFESIRPLDQMNQLVEEWKHVDALLDIQRAGNMLAGAQYRIKETNAMDYVYRSMNCSVELMEENNPEAQYLLRYVRASYQGKVEAVFKIGRQGEKERLRNCQLDNHMLLFHGSNAANLLSILSQGLLVAPPEAPASGYLFGKGIYTADMFSKSANYCYSFNSRSKQKFMLVTQVALGYTKDYLLPSYIEKLPDGFHSSKGCGIREPDPAFDVVLPSGAVLPAGETRNAPKPPSERENRWYRHCLPNNEYIVYKPDQVAIRYLIQFK